MLQIIRHDDVTQLRFSSRRSRSVGYEVSAFLTRGVLVDTGNPRLGGDLDRWLASNHVEGAIVTHSHEDHAGNVRRLVERGIPVQLHAETESRLRSAGRVGWHRRYTWGSPTPLLGTVTPFAHSALTPVGAFGHSPEHHVVWDVDRSTLFGGDLFIGVKVRIANADEDVSAQVGALRRIATLRPERVFDAHRGLLERPVDLLLAKADWMASTIDAIQRRGHAGDPPAVIRDEVLGREGLVGWASAGDYSKMNFVRSALGSTKGALDE